MPYFIYSVAPFARLDRLGEFASFQEASGQARSIRAAQPPHEPRRIRIIYADNPVAAEDLLLQPREAPPDGDD
jgi:hypothetical protein